MLLNLLTGCASELSLFQAMMGPDIIVSSRHTMTSQLIITAMKTAFPDASRKGPGKDLIVQIPVPFIPGVLSEEKFTPTG